jgi:phage gp45-like
MSWRWLTHLLGWVHADEEHTCMYGVRAGRPGHCTVVVPPLAGSRGGGMVFCSEDHAVIHHWESMF